MVEIIERVRRALAPDQVRRGLGRRRRLTSAVLAGIGVLLIISVLRPSAASDPIDAAVPVALLPSQVAVPITVRPASVASALAPGMVIDVVAPAGSTGPPVVAREATVLRLPAGGFGATTEAVVVIAVPEATGTRLASAESSGFGVIIRPTP